MELNLLLICIGLIICFGGIYFRKICAGIMGFSWGTFLGVIFVVFLVLSSDGSLWSLRYVFEESVPLMIVIVTAIVVAVLSAYLDKICAAINTFLSSFLGVLMSLTMIVGDSDLFGAFILLSLLISGILSVVAYTYYNYSFILVTAFSGAFIASIGGMGFFLDAELGQILSDIFDGNRDVGSWVMILTLIFGFIGCYVQMERLKAVANTQGTDTKTENIFGQEGCSNNTNSSFENITSSAKDIGKTLKPHFDDIKKQIKKGWDEFGIDTEQGKKDLKDMLLSYKILFIAPVYAFVVSPILYMLLYVGLYTNVLYEIVAWSTLIAETSALGILGYVVLTKNKKFNLIYQMPYVIGYILSEFEYFQYQSIFTLIAGVMKFAITGFALYLINRLIRKKEIKPIVSAVMAYFMYYFVTYWITSLSVWFYMDIYSIVRVGISIGAIYLVYKKYEDVNIFNFN